MLYDCGITSPEPDQDPKFHRLHRLRPAEIGSQLKHELCILVQTPGIPIEWLYFVFAWSDRTRRFVRDWSDTADHSAEAKANAASITNDDAWRMIRVMHKPETFAGAVPFAVSLALQADPRIDRELAEDIGIPVQKALGWRFRKVFHPLTGERLMPRKGQARLFSG